MKKKTWNKPELHLIAINAKHISAAHEHNYTSKVTSHGHKFYLNTPNHNSFANGIGNSVQQYLS
ncbi:hypothetical protein ACFGVR_03700 [Mucilaginibacter sp. AW1-3]